MKDACIMADLTHDELVRRLSYCPETGVFHWQVRPARNVFIGSVAGATNKFGYRIIRIDGRYYKAHRLAWLYVHGRWPSGEIDHIDGNKGNNGIANLREATRCQNSCNIPHYRTNSSGYKGVSWSKRKSKWYAQIRHNGKCFNLGYYENVGDAANAYASAAKSRHGDFSNTGSNK